MPLLVLYLLHPKPVNVKFKGHWYCLVLGRFEVWKSHLVLIVTGTPKCFDMQRSVCSVTLRGVTLTTFDCI